MNPELNREEAEPGEDKLTEEMVRVAMDRMMPQQGRVRRGQHAKPTGCVRGVFTIRDDVADDLRYGVFHRPNQSFQAIVRFSNSSETIGSMVRETREGWRSSCWMWRVLRPFPALIIAVRIS